MKNLYFIVAASGGHMVKDDMEWRIVKDCNGFYQLQMRFTNEDYSEDPTDGWKTTFITSCPVSIPAVN